MNIIENNASIVFYFVLITCDFVQKSSGNFEDVPCVCYSYQ